jgi:hypothetical protein
VNSTFLANLKILSLEILAFLLYVSILKGVALKKLPKNQICKLLLISTIEQSFNFLNETLIFWYEIVSKRTQRFVNLNM